jgi:hypothetical protein
VTLQNKRLKHIIASREEEVSALGDGCVCVRERESDSSPHEEIGVAKDDEHLKLLLDLLIKLQLSGVDDGGEAVRV